MKRRNSEDSTLSEWPEPSFGGLAATSAVGSGLAANPCDARTELRDSSTVGASQSATATAEIPADWHELPGGRAVEMRVDHHELAGGRAVEMRVDHHELASGRAGISIGPVTAARIVRSTSDHGRALRALRTARARRLALGLARAMRSE